MKSNPEKYHRRSIRIPGYDYSQEGWYFVTICIQNRECILGDVVDGKMVLNQNGKIIDYYWKRLPNHFTHIELYEYQIMPNHMHGIIHIVRAKHSNKGDLIQHLNFYKNASPQQPDNLSANASPVQRPQGTVPGSLGAIMQNFQSITCRKINKINKSPGSRLWQRNYWEHLPHEIKLKFNPE